MDSRQEGDGLFAAVPSHAIQKKPLANAAFVLAMVAWQRSGHFEKCGARLCLTPRSASGAGMLSMNNARTCASDRPVRVVR